MYFEAKGKVNTEKTISLAVARGKELGVNYYIVASNTGETAFKLAGTGVKTVCVTHQNGFRQPGDQEMAPEDRKKLEEMGVSVLTATHLFGGIDRALESRFGGWHPAGIAAYTLKLFGQGVKVAVEVAIMALDAGLIPYGKDVVAIGGSGSGADAAIVIRPAHAKNFFETEIKEIICKPRNIK